jgi:hypothetical protein
MITRGDSGKTYNPEELYKIKTYFNNKIMIAIPNDHFTIIP